MKPALHWGWIVLLMFGLGACAGARHSPVEGNPPEFKGGAVAGRYSVSSQGVIMDTQTGLEWIVGPDQDLDWARAVQWVAACDTAGGRWRMPTRQELQTLHMHGSGKRNMDPVFMTTGWWVWAEARDAQTAWSFSFNHGCTTWDARVNSRYGRVFGVRSRRR